MLLWALMAAGAAQSDAPALPDTEAVIRTSGVLVTWDPSTIALDERGERCDLCHRVDQVRSHPVGVVPPVSMEVPASLPLFDGTMTCTTCHSDAARDHATSRPGAGVSLGMVQTGAGLCQQCHDPTGTTAGAMHANALGRAHGPGADRIMSSSVSTVRMRDSSSALCLSCHDGAMASDAGIGMELAGRRSLVSTLSEHPFGVVYGRSKSQDFEFALRPAALLDDRIRLFENRVECSSCHSLYSARPKLLVMSNERSRLCLSCHEY